MKTTRLLIYSSLFIVGLFSCKAGKIASEDQTKNSELENIISILGSNSYHPIWFKAKAKIQTKMDGRSMNLSSTIISKNEELLWLNGKMFGIEGARLMVTQDSIFALNRLQKNYLADEIDWVANEYALPQLLAEAISLDHLQDVFIGNPILNVIPYTSIERKESAYLLTGILSEYNSALMIDANTWQTRHFQLSDSANTLFVTYSDYRLVDAEHYMAHKRDIIVKRPNEQDIELSIQYHSVIIDKEQNIKFSIPNSYSRM